MIDNMCHRKRNDYKIDMAIDTFWHESIVHKIGKVLLYGAISDKKEKLIELKKGGSLLVVTHKTSCCKICNSSNNYPQYTHSEPAKTMA